MTISGAVVGRVLRVGPQWADVTVNGETRRIHTRPDLLVRPGHYIQIVNEFGIALLPAREQVAARSLH